MALPGHLGAQVLLLSVGVGRLQGHRGSLEGDEGLSEEHFQVGVGQGRASLGPERGHLYSRSRAMGGGWESL